MDEGFDLEELFVDIDGAPTLYWYDGFYALYVLEGDRCFNAVCVEFVSCSTGDNWENYKDLKASRVFECDAYSDGVRHTNFGCGNGYVYYLDSKIMIEVFSKIRELELKLCNID